MSPFTMMAISLLGTVAGVAGVGFYVFNGTKKLVREIALDAKKLLEIFRHHK